MMCYYINVHFQGQRVESPHLSLPLVCQPLVALLILGCVAMSFASIPKHMDIQTMRKTKVTAYEEL